MTNVSGKCLEKIKTHIFYSIIFFFKSRAVYEIMWKNIVGRGRPHKTIRRMRIACWIPKATNTHSHYVTLIAAPPQQSLGESASVLHYACIACPVNIVGRAFLSPGFIIPCPVLSAVLLQLFPFHHHLQVHGRQDFGSTP